MTGKLIMLPLRVWLRSARLLTHVAGGAAERAVSLAVQTIGVASSNGSDHRGRAAAASPEPVWREEPVEEPVSPADVEHPPDEPARRPAPAQPRDTGRDRSVSAVRPLREEPEEAPPVQVSEEPEPVHVSEEPEPVYVSEEPEPVYVSEEPEPVHVSEEPELVREEAEPGAEDGAGAQLTVMEPWNGYARMSARDVIARARQASAAELAAVRLYESRHRSRQTVLAAVDRQLKLVSGPNPA